MCLPVQELCAAASCICAVHHMQDCHDPMSQQTHARSAHTHARSAQPTAGPPGRVASRTLCRTTRLGLIRCCCFDLCHNKPHAGPARPTAGLLGTVPTTPLCRTNAGLRLIQDVLLCCSLLQSPHKPHASATPHKTSHAVSLGPLPPRTLCRTARLGCAALLPAPSATTPTPCRVKATAHQPHAVSLGPVPPRPYAGPNHQEPCASVPWNGPCAERLGRM